VAEQGPDVGSSVKREAEAACGVDRDTEKPSGQYLGLIVMVH
jgi:hypothetical protein